MDDFLPFGSGAYFAAFGLLAMARGMDFLSTWIATPNLVLEGNPVARKLGWKWSIVLNLALCLGFALSPLPAIIIGTTSLLVAARNFQGAWLMRTMGEEFYRSWHVARLQESSGVLFFFCLFGQTALTAVVGAALVLFSQDYTVPMAIGLGVIAYSVAVAFYTLLSVRRLRRAAV
jgi:hypothetical protein